MGHSSVYSQTMPSCTENSRVPEGEDDCNTKEVEEEVWESADCSAAEYTPHSSQRIHFFTTANIEEITRFSYIDIESVDASNMTLLDVCNYTVKEEAVDGSGHCVWMGALFFAHALQLGLEQAVSAREADEARTAKDDVLEHSSSLSSWYSDEYFHGRTVAEMGCGTGAAGIALLKILLARQGSSSAFSPPPILPKQMTFLDNDPEALDLCRINCQQNGIDDSLYKIQLQQPWADLSGLSASSPSPGDDNSGTNPDEDFSFDTVLATDVLYDLKIIRPFLQTASRFLRRSSSTTTIDESNPHNNNSNKKRHLILSHVPRWFLPRDSDDHQDNKGETPYNGPQALEQHIVQEASQFGFQLIHTVRAMEVMAYYQSLTKLSRNNKNHQETRPELLLEALQEMEEANAVLWVFEL